MGDSGTSLESSLPIRARVKLQPAAPEIATAASKGRYVMLAWGGTECPLPVTGFHIYRRSRGGEMKLIGRAPAHQHRFHDHDPAGDGMYFYSVAAISSAGEGPRSAEACVVMDMG